MLGSAVHEMMTDMAMIVDDEEVMVVVLVDIFFADMVAVDIVIQVRQLAIDISPNLDRDDIRIEM